MDNTSEVIFLRLANNSLRAQLDHINQKHIKMIADHKKELNKFKLTVNKKENRNTLNKIYKKKIKVILEIFNNQLKGLNKELHSVTIKSVANNESKFKINFIESDFIDDQEPSSSECLHSKDAVHISDKKYSYLRRSLKLKILSLHKVKQFRVATGLRFNPIIKRLSTGYYIEPVLKMKEKILSLLQSQKIKNEDKILIKLSCDGTQISRNITLINVVFNIINEGTIAATASGCYRIGLFKITNENYECVKTWLPIIWDKMKGLNEVFYNNKEKTFLVDEWVRPINFNTEVFEIKYYFSADWKMMSIVLGLQNANSNFPCLYCETGDLSIKGSYSFN